LPCNWFIRTAANYRILQNKFIFLQKLLHKILIISSFSHSNNFFWGVSFLALVDFSVNPEYASSGFGLSIDSKYLQLF